MTSRSDTSERAFSRPFSVDDLDPNITYPAHAGMTIRDYFAAKAMQGYLADPEWRADVSHRGTADAAYRMADAMLKARDGTQ